MYEVFNLPSHKTCKNCGACCGLIPVSLVELAEIRKYLSEHPNARELAVRQSGRPLECPFRDEENRSCAIYPVRPIPCRLCGISIGMQCQYGNSMNIDGLQFMPKAPCKAVWLNHQDWRT